MKTSYLFIVCLCLSMILQAQVSKTVDITTAGSLKTMLSENELQTISDLTLTGTIDARDFKTMRDEMPILTEVNLSKVTIAAYAGNEGTIPYETDYLMNEIPLVAFYNSNTGKGKTTLTTIFFPLTTELIGGSAFRGCSGLTSISIPASVITIGTCSFADCTALTSIYCFGNTPPNFIGIGDSGYGCRQPFYNVNMDACTLYIPYGTKALYTSADNAFWLEFKNMVEMHGYIFSSKSINLEAKDSVATVDISSDVSWTVNADQSWVTINPTSGTGNQTLIFSIEANNTFALRTSKIMISTDGIEPQILTLVQFGLPKTLTIAAGDLLSALTEEELKGITTLTLTGTIDARDFKTMRDKMPLLRNIDLTGVTIAAFSGMEGTLNGDHSYPADVTPDKAFYGRSSLESVLLPSKIISIGSYTFFSCTKLTAITIPADVTSIEQSTFDGCTSLTSITLPENLNTIGDNAFYQCWSLKSITLPSSVKIIGSFAFHTCYNLKAITIPSAVTSIEQGTFTGCINLTSVTLPENLNKIGYGSFSYCEKLTSVNLPSSITDIGDYAFHSCSGLTSVSIPSSMTKIGNGVFMYCNGLTSVSIPSSITSIGDEAFRTFVGLTSISIPASVTLIGAQAFNNCIGLSSISIPSSVTSIGNYSFYGCTGLKSIIANSQIPIDLNSAENVFLDIDKNSCILYVPTGSKTLYADAFQWKDFKNIVEITTGTIDLVQKAPQFTCYPNPFSQQVVIEIKNPKHVKLSVDIYNTVGQRIKNLAIGNTSGLLNLSWDGTNEKGQKVLTGIYICKMNEQTRQLVYTGNK